MVIILLTYYTIVTAAAINLLPFVVFYILCTERKFLNDALLEVHHGWTLYNLHQLTPYTTFHENVHAFIIVCKHANEIKHRFIYHLDWITLSIPLIHSYHNCFHLPS